LGGVVGVVAIEDHRHLSMVGTMRLSVRYPRWYFAGHSLGGALITLSALDAVANNWFEPQTFPETTVYTYGSLHVGDQDFATAFAQQVPQAYRVANLADWVPSLVGLEADVQVIRSCRSAGHLPVAERWGLGQPQHGGHLSAHAHRFFPGFTVRRAEVSAVNTRVRESAWPPVRRPAQKIAPPRL
jgi:hypothetical protein